MEVCVAANHVVLALWPTIQGPFGPRDVSDLDFKRFGHELTRLDLILSNLNKYNLILPNST